jgi:hypothetical protein
MERTTKRTTKSPCGFVNIETSERCPRPQVCRGYCRSHYQQARRWNWPLPCPPGGHRAIQLKRGRPKKSLTTTI